MTAEHIIAYENDDEVIQIGIRRMGVEYLKAGAPATLILWLVVAIWMVYVQVPSFALGMWTGMIVLVVSWSVFLYFHRINRMREFNGKFGSRLVTLELLPEGMRVTHELGTAVLPWRIYNHLVRHSDVWFLHWSRHDFLVLPAAAFSRAAAAYMADRIGEVGGTVEGCAAAEVRAGSVK